MGRSTTQYRRRPSGAGRKRLNGDIPTKQVQFRLTDAQAEAMRGIMRRLHAGEIKLEQLQELGGIDFTKS